MQKGSDVVDCAAAGMSAVDMTLRKLALPLCARHRLAGANAKGAALDRNIIVLCALNYTLLAKMGIKIRQLHSATLSICLMSSIQRNTLAIVR